MPYRIERCRAVLITQRSQVQILPRFQVRGPELLLRAFRVGACKRICKRRRCGRGTAAVAMFRSSVGAQRPPRGPAELPFGNFWSYF
jgi:hypothetical protein